MQQPESAMADANARPIGAGYLPLPATFDSNRRSQERTSKVHRSVIAFLAVSLIALAGTCMYLDISLEQVTAQLKAASAQLTSASNKGSKHTDACVARAHDPQCIKTPAEYIKILNERAKSHVALNRTACVADNMLVSSWLHQCHFCNWSSLSSCKLNPGRVQESIVLHAYFRFAPGQ